MWLTGKEDEQESTGHCEASPAFLGYVFVNVYILDVFILFIYIWTEREREYACVCAAFGAAARCCSRS